MSLQRQVAFWVGALVAAALFLWLFRGILLPFVAGMALAYLLDPVADRLERLGLGRLAATLAILVAFVLLFVVALLLLVPILTNQLTALLARMPDYMAALQQLLTSRVGPLLERLVPEGASSIQSSLGDVVSQVGGWFGRILQSVWSGGQAIISVVSLFVVTPVVAFYLLYDWDRMIATVDGWLPRRNRETVCGLAREIDDALSGFLRGQGAVCLILGTMYAVGLSVIGLNSGLLIGIVAGLISFIPYVGTAVGFVLATGVALVQFWPDWPWILAVVGVFVAGQMIEGNILQPKLVGGHVGLHPVWLMFALFAFGSLFGFVGMLLAVPLAAAAGVLARFGLRRYLDSPLYSGGPPEPR